MPDITIHAARYCACAGGYVPDSFSPPCRPGTRDCRYTKTAVGDARGVIVVGLSETAVRRAIELAAKTIAER